MSTSTVHTGLEDCLNMQLSCFRIRISGRSLPPPLIHEDEEGKAKQDVESFSKEGTKEGALGQVSYLQMEVDKNCLRLELGMPS